MERNLEQPPPLHGEWSPEEIKGQNFRTSLLGFSRREVRDFLRLVSKLWARMLEHQGILQNRIVNLEKEVADFQAREAEIAKLQAEAQSDAQIIRESARLEAEKLMNETEDRADAIRKRTENWLEEVIAQVEETQRQKKNFLTAFRSALDSHYALIESEEEDTEPLTSRLAGVLRGSSHAEPPTF